MLVPLGFLPSSHPPLCLFQNSIRVGDVFALLIEFYYSQRSMKQAYELIENMQSRKIILSPYLDSTMVNNICQAVGAPPIGGGGGDADDDGIEEDIAEDIASSGDDAY